MAGVQSFCIDQNAAFCRTLIWKNKATNLPNDLTGYTAKMQLASGYNQTGQPAPTVYYTMETGDENGSIVLGGTAGTIILFIPASETETFTWIDGVYDLLLIDPNGIPLRLLQGNINISAGVTTI